MQTIRHPSPNFGERRRGARPDMVVIHYTGMADFASALERLCDPTAEVSAHYLISEAGDVFALVPEELRAWHAGAGGWGSVTDVNSRSLGIELANTGRSPFPEPQMAALEHLLEAVMARWSVPSRRVIGHSDMAPERKEDPGPLFDWARLARLGLAVWPQECPAAVGDVAAFLLHARTFGYPDARPEKLLSAFRARFRPRVAGPLDALDVALAADLARRFPVDHAGVDA